MKLPNSDLVRIEREKITEYLLNRKHPDNGGKADFFLALGFSQSDWETMAEALRSVAIFSEVSRRMESRHGTKYIVDGEIESPMGQTPKVRTVWIVDAGESFARLVTAYPHEDSL